NRFLAIVGPSGSGKSSLALAGLLPVLRAGGLDDSARWPIVICRPGPDALESLARKLTGLDDGRPSLTAMDVLVDKLKAYPRALHRFIGLSLRDATVTGRPVVLIDQFEEIFTLGRDESRRRALIDNLLYAAGIAGGQTVVVLTIRADFYGKCAPYPAL